MIAMWQHCGNYGAPNNSVHSSNRSNLLQCLRLLCLVRRFYSCCLHSEICFLQKLILMRLVHINLLHMLCIIYMHLIRHLRRSRLKVILKDLLNLLLSLQVLLISTGESILWGLFEINEQMQWTNCGIWWIQILNSRSTYTVRTIFPRKCIPRRIEFRLRVLFNHCWNVSRITSTMTLNTSSRVILLW